MEMKPITTLRENAEAHLHALKEQLRKSQVDRGLTTEQPDLLICRIACMADFINVLESSEKELKV